MSREGKAAPGGGKARHYTPLVVVLSFAINLAIAVLFFLPAGAARPGADLTLLPRLNAVLNSFTFVFLGLAFSFIRRKDVANHRRFILAAFTTTALFLVSYLVYHSLAESTPYGGEGPLRYLYYFLLLTHVVLAVVIVPLALFTLFTGLGMQVQRHRRIARWTMPLWLYVSLTGVLVYLLISPYY